MGRAGPRTGERSPARDGFTACAANLANPRGSRGPVWHEIDLAVTTVRPVQSIDRSGRRVGEGRRAGRTVRDIALRPGWTIAVPHPLSYHDMAQFPTFLGPVASGTHGEGACMGRHRGTSHRWRGPVAAGGVTVLVLALAGLFVGRAMAGGPEDPVVAIPLASEPCLGPCDPATTPDPTADPTTAAPPANTGTPTATNRSSEPAEPTGDPGTEAPTRTPTRPPPDEPSQHPTHTPRPDPPGRLDPPHDRDPLVDIDVDTWDGGFRSQVSITNRSDDPVNWWIELRYADAEIHDTWNASVRITDDGLVATGDRGDFTIEPAQTVTFGFTARGTSATPRSCSLNGDTCDRA